MSAAVPNTLGLANRHIAEALPRIERQREIIAELRAKGRDAQLAQDVCDTMTDTLRLMCWHRRYLRRTLRIIWVFPRLKRKTSAHVGTKGWSSPHSLM